MACEMWLDRMARLLKMEPEHIRRMNFIKEGEETHFGQVMECNQVRHVNNLCSESGIPLMVMILARSAT